MQKRRVIDVLRIYSVFVKFLEELWVCLLLYLIYGKQLVADNQSQKHNEWPPFSISDKNQVKSPQFAFPALILLLIAQKAPVRSSTINCAWPTHVPTVDALGHANADILLASLVEQSWISISGCIELGGIKTTVTFPKFWKLGGNARGPL